MNATHLAATLGVSKARVSQWLKSGVLNGCYQGEGRGRRFDLDQVRVALDRGLDQGQMLGNGARTKKALLAFDRGAEDSDAPAAPPPATRVHDGALTSADPDRYEMARIVAAEEDARRKRRENEREEGNWVLAEEAERATARLVAREIGQFEAVLRDGARALADRLEMDFREVRAILLQSWRDHRAARARQLGEEEGPARMTDTETGADI